MTRRESRYHRQGVEDSKNSFDNTWLCCICGTAECDGVHNGLRLYRQNSKHFWLQRTEGREWKYGAVYT